MEIPEDIMQLVKATAKATSEETARRVVSEQVKAEKAEKVGRCDRRLRNTKLLLRNYRLFESHCTGAVFTDEEGENDGRQEESALEILDMMMNRQSALTVESIRRSCQRTKIMVRHIDAMLELYEIYCERSHKPELERGYRELRAMYIDPEPMTADKISEQFHVGTRQVYNDIDSATEKLSALFFGVDSLENSF